MKRFLLFILLNSLLVVNNISAQCMLAPVTLQSRLSNSSLVIEGKVIAQKSFWNKNGNYIYTSSLIDVLNVFKGSVFTTKLEIITDGGQIDLTKQVVEPSLELKAGDVGVFTLNNTNNTAQFGYGVYVAYADMQGFIKYDLLDNSATEPFAKYNSIENDVYGALRSLLNIQIKSSGYINGAGNKAAPVGVASITSFAPTSITAGTATSLTITGVGFGATQGTGIVEFKNADDGGATFIQPHASQYLSWSNTQIVVEVPSRTTSGTLTTSGTAGTGQVRVTTVSGATLSAQTLTVNYGHLNAYFSNTLSAVQIFNTRHHGQNGAGGITWHMFNGFDAMAAPKASFLRAFQSWRCATYINWQVGAPVATNTIAFDGTNLIRFDIGAELPAGVLGRCTSYFNGCIFASTTIYFFVTELDICFDDGANWQYGPAAAVGTQYDFESVVLHELGHGHQLTHVINNLDVMHFSIANATNKRVLNVDDINGGNAVMTRNLSGAVCGNLIMTALSATTCAMVVPTASFNVVSPVCVGQNVPLNDLSTGAPYAWLWAMPGGTPNTATVQNTSTTYTAAGIYTITLVAANASGTSTPFSKTISVVSSPTVSITGSNTICSGNSTTLTASGATTYTWNPGSLTGSVQVLTPATGTTYTVIGSNGSCTNSSVYSVTVNPTPTITVNSATICTGGTATLTASGATTYSWMPGSLVGATQTLSPASTTTYVVTGTSVGCSGTKTTNINVVPIPTVSVAGTATICSGNSTTLTATGATTYTWNPGALTGSVQTLSPAATTTYVVTGSNGTCSGIKNYIVNVNPTPTITVNSATICTGNSATLTANGATTYTWNPGALTGSVQTLSPAGTTIYTITGVSGSCSSNVTTNITVNATPTVNVFGTTTVICSGNTTTLTSTGATTYTWNPGALTGSLQAVSPISTTIYTVTGSTGSCSGTKNFTLAVNPSPTITASATATLICVGQSNTLTASGASTYTWNPGAVSGSPIAVSPTITTIYTVTGTSSLACTSSKTVNVAVSPCTNINNISLGKINIYPNPTQGNVTIDFGTIYTGKISVYNTIGQELLIKTVSETENVNIDLSNFAKGIYIIRLRSEKGIEKSFKIIKD